MNTRTVNAYEDDQVLEETSALTVKQISTSILFTLLVLCLLMWVGMTLMRPDFLPIRNVRVEGEFRQLAPDRLQAIVTDTVRGGFFNVNVEVIQKVLLIDPWIYRVTVRRNWPDSLTVQVTEQVAVAQWNGEGLINIEGKFFAPEPYTYPTGLPVLRGPENTSVLVLAQLNRFNGILNGTGFVISELTLNDRRSWTAKLSEGPLLILGKRNLSNRMERFTSFMASGMSNGLPAMEIVDLRYTNGFAIRWKHSSHNSELGRNYHG